VTLFVYCGTAQYTRLLQLLYSFTDRARERSYLLVMAVRAFVVMALLQFVGCDRQPAETQPVGTEVRPGGDARQRLSPDLRKILVDPGDKGPLNYTIDAEGNEWLVNPRNGYRYPVDDGVPVMLLDEGAKHRDPRPVSQ
jgi:uncharacterized protein YbaR (Trm112 family)